MERIANIFSALWSLLSLELIGKVVAIIIGTIGIAYQFKQLRTTSRSKLKTDLEILKLLDKDEKDYILVKESISNSISEIYVSRETINERNRYVYRTLFTGVILMFLSSLIGLFMLRNNFTWWVLLPAIYFLSGLGYVIGSFGSRKRLPRYLEHFDSVIVSIVSRIK